MSLTCLSADPFGPVFVLISYPFKDYDEPKTLVMQNCRAVSKALTGYKMGRPTPYSTSARTKVFGIDHYGSEQSISGA